MSSKTAPKEEYIVVEEDDDEKEYVPSSEISTKVDRSKPHRHYVFTLNNPDESWDDGTTFHKNVRYCVWSLEQAPKTGTLHYQGYVELEKPQRTSWMKEHFSPTAHFEGRKGTRDQARNYCMQDVKKGEVVLEGPYEYGEWKSGGQGKRNDLASLTKAVQSGARIRDIIDANPAAALKYIGNIEKLKKYYPVHRKWKTEVHILWGPGGVGKSAYANKWAELNTNDDYYRLRVNEDKKLWWCGYDQQKVIVIDEFEAQIPWREMLQLCDRFAYTGQTKGSHTAISAEVILITSNLPPEKWYPGENYELLKRRISSCTLIKKLNVTSNEVGGNTGKNMHFSAPTEDKVYNLENNEEFRMNGEFPERIIPNQKDDDTESVEMIFVDEDGREVTTELSEEQLKDPEIPKGYVEDRGSGYENNGEETSGTVLHNEHGEPIGYHEYSEIIDVPNDGHQSFFERNLPIARPFRKARKPVRNDPVITGYKKVINDDGSITYKRDKNGRDIMVRDPERNPPNIEIEKVNINPPASQ